MAFIPQYASPTCWRSPWNPSRGRHAGSILLNRLQKKHIRATTFQPQAVTIFVARLSPQAQTNYQHMLPQLAWR